MSAISTAQGMHGQIHWLRPACVWQISLAGCQGKERKEFCICQGRMDFLPFFVYGYEHVEE